MAIKRIPAAPLKRVAAPKVRLAKKVAKAAGGGQNRTSGGRHHSGGDLMRAGALLMWFALCGGAWCQVDTSPGATPKDALNPRMYRALKGDDAIAADVQNRLRAIERDHMQIEVRNTDILDRLKVMEDIPRRVSVNEESLRNQIEREKAHENLQLTDPGTIANLATAIALLKTDVGRLMYGLGLLIMGITGWAIKYMRDSAKLLDGMTVAAEVRSTNKKTLKTLEEQTNSITTDLVKTVGEAEYARGLKAGTEKWKEDH